MAAARAGLKALEVIGGEFPVAAKEFSRRAASFVLNPMRNPVKEAMDASADVRSTPPMLGLLSDIPWHQLRESEVLAWARAGFTWVVADGEHSALEGRYGREQMRMLLRHGMTPVQRLHREARSEHGDALTMGARATMAPYGTTVAAAAEYLQSVSYPVEGAATPFDRGVYPMRMGDYAPLFEPAALRAGESDTQAWVQFETAEYIRDHAVRDSVLERMRGAGVNKACGFVGALDAVMRSGASAELDADIDRLIRTAADRQVHMGCMASGADADAVEQSMAKAIEAGCRLIAVNRLASDMPYHGASHAAAPFWRAAARCGF